MNMARAENAFMRKIPLKANSKILSEKDSSGKAV